MSDSADCWFCSRGGSSEKTVKRVELYDVVDRDTRPEGNQMVYRVRFRTREVAVPRCAECRAAHIRKDLWIFLGGVPGLLVGGLLVWKLWPPFWQWSTGRIFGGLVVGSLILAIPVVLFFVSSVVLWQNVGIRNHPKHVRGDDTAYDHPEVKALLAAGWEKKRPNPKG